MLKFITGNKGKVKEMEAILAPLKFSPVNIDLDEIQDLDPYKIIRHKLSEAFNYHHAEFFIEDTSVYYKAFKNRLPGPFMKWFLQTLEPKGLYELARKMGRTGATMQTIIAYAKSPKQVYFFEASTNGSIVKPKGGYGFGVDVIFKPAGSAKTLAELKSSGSSIHSARYKAAMKLKKFLNDAKK